ncbi:MAG: RIP metalloprotease RseP [Flavobacteriales bacterium]|nr:RIP metalloprotease RseP [Flavobacteriales bacterium]
MTGLIMAGQLILSLAILVTFHELGHYLAARAFGIRVEKFYLFFDAWGKKLFSIKKGDTEYGIGWLPIGGYVKIAGMIDESVDKEQMKQPPQPWEFRSKPAWQRFIVMIGGIVVNLILGFLFLVMVMKVYEKDYVTIDTVNQEGILAGEIGEKLGFKDGDKLITLNGNTYERYDDYMGMEAIFGGDMVVERDGELKTITIPDTIFRILKSNRGALIGTHESIFISELSDEVPNAKNAGLMVNDRLVSINDTAIRNFAELSDKLAKNKGKEISVGYVRNGEIKQTKAQVDTAGKLGFGPELKIYESARTKYSLGSAIKYSLKESWDNIYFNAVGLKRIATGKIPANQVKSVIGMAKFFGGTWDWHRFWSMTAMISLALALMNALPIPALDGGHMLFLTWEMITGKPASEKVLLVAQYIGMALLLTLMALTMGNDIWNLIKGN